MLKVDLHLHTADDPLDRIRHSGAELVDRAAALGFDALAITLHDAQFDAARLRAYARERGVLLIPGVERTIGWRAPGQIYGEVPIGFVAARPGKSLGEASLL